VATFQMPLVDTTSALRSFESVGCLASLGNALRSSPYDTHPSVALQVLLGDWKNITSFPTQIFSDWQARLRFYSHLGFDGRLTTLWEPAFTNSLYHAGILRRDLLQPVPAGGICEDREKRVAGSRWQEKRRARAFGMLEALETQLR